MHLRTRAQQDEPNRNHRSHCSQVQPNSNSLQESPIPTNSHLQSDHSPQPFFYPTSLQPRKQATDKCVDLKSQTIQLLGKLKQWLRELCLTQACSQDVAEQLEPIIQEIMEAGETSEDSVWVDNLQLGHRGQRSMLMRDSKNIYVSSGVESENGHGKHQSVLIHEEGPEVSLLNQSEKNLVRLFFKRYTRLLENCLARIGRCTGEKKLKFLVETTMRNIFGQTLRVSYDLKIVQHRLREERRLKAEMNRNMNIRLLKDRLQLLFMDRGFVKNSFQLIRAIYSKGINQDSQIVSVMMTKMSKLAAISQRKTRTQLQRITFSWRKNAHQMKVQEDLYLVEQVRMQVHEILGQLASAGQDTSQFGLLWRGLLERHINYLLQQIFAGQDCVFLSLQDILHERLAKRQKQISIIDFMEDQQYGGSSHRSQICKQHPFLNEFTIDQLKNCILSGEIYRSEKTSSSLLLLPIKPASGIVFACLAASNSLATASFSRSPMTLHSFRLLLRIVELITPLLEDLSNMCQRVEKGWREVQKNSHYELLYKEYLKIDMTRDNPVGFDGHLQVERQSKHQMAIDSHRLQTPNEVVGILMERFAISNLMIYHCADGIINQQPCIVCGEAEAARSQQHIIQSIYRQLLDSGKDLLAITRSNRTFNVLPLRKDNKNVGLIHMTCQNQDKIDYYLISECLVPLILKFEGAINCSECQVSLKIPLDTSVIDRQQINSQIEQNSSELILNNLSSLVTCDSLIELQTLCNSIVKSQGNLFHKIVYRIDMNDAANYYSLQPQPIFFKLKEAERITHQQMFIEEYDIPTNGSSFTQLVFTYPVFPNPQLHIYQHEQTYPFRLLAFPIKNETQVFGYFLIGHYVINSQSNHRTCEFFRNLTNCLAMNGTIFKSIRLDDQHLNQQFRNTSQQASKEIEGTFLTFLKDWKGKGKILEQFQDLANKISSSKAMSSKKAVFSLMKVNRQSRDIKCLTSTSSHLTQIIAVPEQIFNIIEQSTVLSTHEKLQTSQCKLKTQNINRTIRPMKANYLHNANIFFPDLPHPAKSKIIESIKTRFQLEGWIANEYWPILNEISNRAIQKSNNDKMYFLINLGHRQSKGYLLFIEQDLLQPKQVNIFTESLLFNLQTVFSKIISRSRSYQSDPTERKRALLQLSLLMQKGFSVEQAVHKLYLNWQIVSRNASHLCRVFSQIIGQTNCQSKNYLQLLKIGFEQIQMVNLQKQYRDSIFVEKISSILKKYNQHKLLKYSFEAIDQSISETISFAHVRASKKIIQIFNNNATSTKQLAFMQIQKYSEFRATNRRVSKTTSAYKLVKLLKSINLRESQRYFFNQVQKLYDQFSNSFQLISEECHKISFNTRQKFMRFANQRCMAVIDHLHFGSTVRIEILTGLMIKDALIIYRLNRQGNMEQIIAERPVSLEPELHNGYIFVSAPIDSFPNTHYLLYKITTKNHINTSEEATVIGKVISEGMVPCYINYLIKRVSRTSKICEVIMNFACKQLWNGSASPAQGIYMFGRGLCAEYQCDKLRALCSLKSLKQAGSISELKMVQNAINQESRIYYSLEYQHNALSNALTGTPTRQEAEVLHKYGELITREKLKKTREETQNLEQEEQRKLLSYQIKSKTFATSKIVTFSQKRENQDVQDLSLTLLRNKQNNDNSNKSTFEKVYVENKLQTKTINDKINNQKKKLKKAAARGLWLTIGKLSRNQYIKKQKSIFHSLLLSARPTSHNRY